MARFGALSALAEREVSECGEMRARARQNDPPLSLPLTPFLARVFHSMQAASMGINGRACERFVRSKALETDLAEVRACACVRA